MSETNRDDISIAEYPFLSIGVTSLGIDLRRILLALRTHIPQRKLLFSSTSRADVFIPTLREKFILMPHNGYLVIKARKKIKIPMIMEDDMLSIKVIDVVVAWVEHLNINDKFNIEL